MMGKGTAGDHGELQDFIVNATTNIFSCINTVVHDSYLNMQIAQILVHPGFKFCLVFLHPKFT